MLDDLYVWVALQPPLSPDYIPGLEEPQSPPPPDFVPEPVYPEFMPLEDEILPAEEQPLPAADSPTADSPGYVPESDPEEDPEEDDDEDPDEDPFDYPADEGGNGDDEDESSDDDEDEDVDIEWDEEEEEHPAPADSTVVALPAIDQAPSAEETEPFETDEFTATPPPHPAYRVTARISIPDPAMIWLRAEAASTSYSLPLPPLSPIPAPTSSPPLLLPSTNRREDRPEVTLPPRKRLSLLVLDTREIRHDLERDVRYGITDSWDAIVEAMQGTPVVTDVAEFSQRMTEFETRVRQDTDEIYTRDRRAHACTARLIKAEARMFREDWERSIDASDLACVEVMSLRTTVLAQQLEIRELQSADHRRQTVITKMLAADHRRQVQLTKALKLLKGLQTQMVELQRQQGPANGLAHPELPKEAGSSS
ncbi:hypothetical protein Tco_0678796 [Tanacetum coccineum]|uniref:Uncharacterized protein n=1 Tax=Tanacetum coccineum TaxID=301880 RepID=A0ABQ4XG42_9ASTR